MISKLFFFVDLTFFLSDRGAGLTTSIEYRAGLFEPAVIDSNDLLRDPAGVLAQLCHRLELEWLPAAMLQWPAGPRASDGVWAPHWYQNVEASTGFAPWRPREIKLETTQRELADAMDRPYRVLAERRIRPRDE